MAINPSTGSVTPVTAVGVLGSPESGGESAFDPVGQRYFAYNTCVTPVTDYCLYSIDTTNGNVTSVDIGSPEDNPLADFQLVFDPTTGTLYGLTDFFSTNTAI